MNREWVVDASVGLKWVLDEDYSDIAAALLGYPLWVPDLWLLECGNALAMRARKGALPAAGAERRMVLLAGSPVSFAPLATLTSAAFGLSIETGATVYDCCYLALALQRGALVVTDDGRFARRVRQFSKYAPQIVLLADMPAILGLPTPQ